MHDFYDDAHWQELLGVIAERVGTEKFFAMVTKLGLGSLPNGKARGRRKAEQDHRHVDVPVRLAQGSEPGVDGSQPA
jgi:hypothetical protein